MKTIDYENIELKDSCLLGLCEHFEVSKLEALGRKVRFIERSTSRLSAWAFLQLNTCLIHNGKEMSLNEMAVELWDSFSIKLTKQSLDERFSIYGVALMRKCYERVFEQILLSPEAGLQTVCGFNRVILRDSTSFQLPAILSAHYEGNGGDTTGSVMKIQTEYDLLSGKMVRLDFRNGKENDTEWLNQKGIEVLPNDLHLMDLGYYKLAHLSKIASTGGYFISRYKVGTTLFEKDESGLYQELDWQELILAVQESGFEQVVYVGAGKDKLQVRLSLQAIPAENVQKRLKKYKRKEANQSNNKSQYQISALKEQLAAYNIFITNTSSAQLDSSQIYTFYKLRWQIELLFKIWKSLFQIDKIGKMNMGRFMCYLYGKLIAILISGHIQALFSRFMEEKADFELSEWKAHKFIKKN